MRTFINFNTLFLTYSLKKEIVTLQYIVYSLGDFNKEDYL